MGELKAPRIYRRRGMLKIFEMEVRFTFYIPYLDYWLPDPGAIVDHITLCHVTDIGIQQYNCADEKLQYAMEKNP